MTLKGWRTVAFNILAAVPLVIDAALPMLHEIASLPEIRDLIPSSWLPYYALSLALGNVFLRSITTTPLGRRE